MDLTQLANLGEFIGGLAVLATLVYLAIQVSPERRRADRANLPRCRTSVNSIVAATATAIAT